MTIDVDVSTVDRSSGELASSPSAVAIMQPYFIPYAGYFRLLAATDLFVIFDCVQFPRRGWVHRNRLVDASGRECWLTLPLAKASRDVRISDLSFSHNACAVWEERLRRVPLIDGLQHVAPEMATMLRDVSGTPVDYLERLLGVIVSHLGLRWHVLRSSALRVPHSIRGQERIIEIARRLGARRYINAPGGRTLYNAARFEEAGIELRFLDHYNGPSSSILRRIIEEDRQSLVDDILASSRTSP